MSSEVPKKMSMARQAFEKIKQNKRFWLLVFLLIIIGLLIWLLIFYFHGKLKLKQLNNNKMILSYQERGGTSIGSINSSNPQFIHLLRDYYVMSSYNSCCGGDSLKDFVDLTPLKQVINQGARLLDFEIYSKNGNPIIAAGPEASSDGKFYLKGTYNSISFKSVMSTVKTHAFSGRTCPNPDDPLFLSFRIKTNSKLIYDYMGEVLRKLFGGHFLQARYSYEGRNIKSGKDSIPNIPLLNLKRKVIILVQDPNHNYRETKLHEFINISGKGTDGTGMPFAEFYKNKKIIMSHAIQDVINTNKKFLGFSQPDYSDTKNNSPAIIHQSKGVQFVMMNFSFLDDEHLINYLNYFNKKGSAFVLKPNHLRYFEKKIKPPKPQDPKVSYAPRPTPLLPGGVYTPPI